MKRKSFVSVGVFLLLLAGLGYLWLTAPAKENVLQVTADSPLTIEKISIQKGWYSINSNSDIELLDRGLEVLIFEGTIKAPLKTICGVNDFLIVYDQKYYTLIRHLIPTDFYNAVAPPHQYNFHLEQQGKKIVVNFNVLGPNSMNGQKELLPVVDANNQLWGSFKG